MNKLNNLIKNKKILTALVSCLVILGGIGTYALTRPNTKPKENKTEVIKEDVKEEIPVVNNDSKSSNENKENTNNQSSNSKTNTLNITGTAKPNNSSSSTSNKSSISNNTNSAAKPGNTTSNTQAKPNHNVSKPVAPSKPATPKPQPKPSNPKPSTPVVAKNVYDLNVPYINQYKANAPMGCEASALLQALNYKKYALNYNLANFLKEMPVASDGNPNHGFSSSPYVVLNGVYQSIYPQPLNLWGRKYGNVSNISGSSVATLKQEIKNGNPVVVYVTFNFKSEAWKTYPFGRALYNMHVVTLAGYNEQNNRYKIVDPAKGTYWIDGNIFESRYNYLKFAVVVR